PSCSGQAKLFSDALLQLLPFDSPITAFPSGRPVCNHRSTLCAPKAPPKVSTTRENPYCTSNGPAAHAPLRRSAPHLRPEKLTQVPYLSSPWRYLIRPNFTHPHRDSQTIYLPPYRSNPRRASSTNPEDCAYPQLQQGDRETSLPVRRYPLLGLDVGHSCGTRKRSHPHPAFFQVSVAKLNSGKAAYRPPQEDPS
ncbi:hypothetical protein CCUS01_13840, partial [Colletotrichum cuscutae]